MPSEVRFSRAQKWDLVRMSAAAVASTVFFTAPLFLVRPSPSPQAKDEPRPTLAASPVAAGDPASAPAAIRDTPPAATADTVAVVTSTEFAVESTPALQSTHGQALRPRTSAQRSPVLRAHATVRTDPAQQSSFKHRLVRFFSGVGKYTVKPFPSVTTSGN
jgi:hypothetical protein